MLCFSRFWHCASVIQIGHSNTRSITCATLQSIVAIHIFFLSILLMSLQDRTHEFKSCVDSIRSRTALGPRGAEAKQRLIQTNGKPSKSEFSRMASSIGKDISSTTIKLNKLGQRRLITPCRINTHLTCNSGETENIVRRPAS